MPDIQESLSREGLKDALHALENDSAVVVCLRKLDPTMVALLVAAMNRSTLVRSLDLREHALGPDGVATLAPALVGKPALLALDLAGGNAGPAGAEAVGAVLSQTALSTLDLSGNAIGDRGMAALAAALEGSGVRTLKVAGNEIGNDGMSKVAEALARNPGLRTLDLARNRVGSKGIEAVSAVLSQNDALHTLDLSGNRLDAACVATLARSLAENTALHTLRLGSNAVGDAGATVLAASFGHLDTLVLASNAIGDAGATALAIELERNVTLRTLDLANNAIGDDGLSAFAAVLVRNATLTVLDLSSNRAGDVGAATIAAALERNSSMQTLRLSASDTGNTGPTSTAAAVSRVGTLHTISLSGSLVGEPGMTGLLRNRNPLAAAPPDKLSAVDPQVGGAGSTPDAGQPPDQDSAAREKKAGKIKLDPSSVLGQPPPTVIIPAEFRGTFSRFGDGRKQLPLVPPLNFSLVATGVYRSGYPNEKNFPFLEKLKIKTIVYLCAEPYLKENRQQLEALGVEIVQFKTEGNLEPFVEISDAVLIDALRCVLDPAKHPVLVHCEKGNHRTGCLIGCLRKLMNWSLTSIFAEYRRHTGGNVRVLDLQAIELFSCAEITLPHSSGWVS